MGTAPQALSFKSNPSFPLLFLMTEMKHFRSLVTWNISIFSICQRKKKRKLKFYLELFSLVLCIGSQSRKTKPNQTTPHHTNNYSNGGCASLGCPKRVFPKASLAELGNTRTSWKHCYHRGRQNPTNSSYCWRALDSGEQENMSHNCYVWSI